MIKVALIGCGAIAEGGHLPALRRHQRFSIAAVCDTRPGRARLLSRLAGEIPAFEDWRQLLDTERIDAAVLALPPEASPDVAVECLRRGVHVLDEKPLAATIADGRRVARAAAEAGAAYQVGFVLRYGDWVHLVRDLARTIGNPMRIRVAVYDERLDRSDAVHLDRIQGFLRNSSAMTHEGSHVIDYAALWNPSPWTRIRSKAERTEPDLDGPNLWHAAIDLADGSALEVEIGWLLPKLPPCVVEVEGPGGRLELDPTRGVGRWRIEEGSGALTPPPLAPEWDRQYDAFASAVDRGRAEVATAEDGLRALEVTAACEISAREGKPLSRADFLAAIANRSGLQAMPGDDAVLPHGPRVPTDLQVRSRAD